MQAGTALIGRRLLAAFVAVMLMASVMLLFADTAAQASHEPPDDDYTSSPGDGSNEAGFWDTFFGLTSGSCEKLTQSGSSAFVMPAEPDGEDWYALVVKQGSPSSNDGPDNFIYLDPVAGHSYPSAGNQAPGFSHLIVCSVPETTDTTEPEETTTTEGEGTTTTTEAEVTTTTEAEVTTTTVGDTTTTIGDEVLPTVITTSTTAAPTTTVEDEVLDTEVLPFTGSDNDMLALLAGGLGLLGALVLASTRRMEEN